MINKKIVIFIYAAILFISGNVFSETSNSTQLVGSTARYYAGVDASNIDDGSSNNSVLAWIGRAGKNFNENFSIEARIGLPTDIAETYPYPNWDKSIAIDKLYGVYGLGHLKIGESVSLYGLIGYTRVGVTVATYGLGTKSVDDYDFSFGLGFNKAFGRSWLVTLEYIQYLSNAEFEINATAIGATYYF